MSAGPKIGHISAQRIIKGDTLHISGSGEAQTVNGVPVDRYAERYAYAEQRGAPPVVCQVYAESKDDASWEPYFAALKGG